MEENAQRVGFVPAICFVPRVGCMDRPATAALSRDEVENIIAGAEDGLEVDEERNESRQDEEGEEEEETDSDEETSEDESMASNMDVQNGDVEENSDENDEYGFHNYDRESNVNLASLSNIVRPEYQIPDEEDSETEDDKIKPTDNLLLVGHFETDSASLEVWIFNSDEGSFYIHHEIMVPNFPLCIEWINYDPDSREPGNMCAIGGMDPVITIWDLDIQDAIIPCIKLGRKMKRHEQQNRYGHTDAVVDLSWNRIYSHVLASGSLDQTVILWDLDQRKVHSTIGKFPEKVHSLKFHPTEAQILLTGCADKKARLMDCMQPDTALSSALQWEVQEEIERVVWNPNDHNYFMLGDNGGSIHYADRRQPTKFLWSHKAHEQEVSGICFNSAKPNLLSSTSIDGNLKIWKFNSQEIEHVYTHELGLGRLQCMDPCPEDPFTLAFGGETDRACTIYNIKNSEAVRRVFGIPTYVG